MMRIPKAQIFEACKLKQEQIISDFKTEISNLKSEIYDRDVIPSQGDSSSSERHQVLLRYEQELEHLEQELGVLDSISDEKICEIVELGAVVITDSLSFFVSISAEELNVNGDKIFGISVQAPLYKAMKGKKKGDTFSINQKQYEILDVY